MSARCCSCLKFCKPVACAASARLCVHVHVCRGPWWRGLTAACTQLQWHAPPSARVRRDRRRRGGQRRHELPRVLRRRAAGVLPCLLDGLLLHALRGHRCAREGLGHLLPPAGWRVQQLVALAEGASAGGPPDARPPCPPRSAGLHHRGAQPKHGRRKVSAGPPFPPRLDAPPARLRKPVVLASPLHTHTAQPLHPTPRPQRRAAGLRRFAGLCVGLPHPLRRHARRLEGARARGGAGGGYWQPAIVGSAHPAACPRSLARPPAPARARTPRAAQWYSRANPLAYAFTALMNNQARCKGGAKEPSHAERCLPRLCVHWPRRPLPPSR